MDRYLAQLVRNRADGRCEYCQMPAALYRTVFHVDHVIAVKHGGDTSAENLALACLHCNLHKGTDLASLDPTTGLLTRLFNPRTDRWHDHFTWAGPMLIGRTDVGRTTLKLLRLNEAMLVAIRESLIAERRWPPIA